MTTRATRRYDSTRRRETAEATRREILAAATRLFAERGWAGTSMKDLATQARVSVETIYTAVGNKTALLKVALDVAVAGDDQPVPLSARHEFEALAEGGLADRVQTLGRFLSRTHRRTGALYQALQHAASGDPELAALAAQSRRDQRDSFRDGLTMVAGRPLTDIEAEGATAVLGNDVHLILTGPYGWSDEQYTTWAADTVVRLLDLREEDR
jgi:AcrR family transcriptional regulator